MTDHRAEAEALLKLGADYSDPRNPPHAAGQQAQVHATLALVDATNAQTAAMERIARAAPSRAVGL